MGLFSKIKKAFKKVVKGVKKVVKKVVKGVKKVVKKIGSSKILKALAIAAAVVVTGGAAMTAFGANGAFANSAIGKFMMSTSGKMLGGQALGVGATGPLGFLQKAGNLAIQTVSKPFGAVGGALGSTARVGVNLVQGQAAFAPGPAPGASAPFSGAAVAGTPPTPPAGSAAASASNPDYFFGNKWGDLAVRTGAGVVGGVVSGAAQAKLMEGDPSGQMAGLANESKEYQDKLQVFAENNNINLDDIYGQLTYGTADPAYQINSELYRQDTVGVPA